MIKHKSSSRSHSRDRSHSSSRHRHHHGHHHSHRTTKQTPQPPPLGSNRTVIYEEVPIVTAPSIEKRRPTHLKSSVITTVSTSTLPPPKRVVEYSSPTSSRNSNSNNSGSFYRRHPETQDPEQQRHHQQRINYDIYHSEIIDDEDIDEDDGERFSPAPPPVQTSKHHHRQNDSTTISKKTKRRHQSSSDRSKRQRQDEHHSEPDDDDAEQHTEDEKKSWSKQKTEENDTEMHENEEEEDDEEEDIHDQLSSPEKKEVKKDKSQLREKLSSSSRSTSEHETTPIEDNGSNDKRQRQSSNEQRSRSRSSVSHSSDNSPSTEPLPDQQHPHRSRFDHDEDEKEEEGQRRHSRTHSSDNDDTSPVEKAQKRRHSSPPTPDEIDDDVEDDGIIKEEFEPKKPSLPSYYPAIQGCRRVEEFQCLNRIEEGTYGVVFRAKETKTGEIVALKRLKMEKEKEGFPITSLREICCILKSQHENVVTVREIVVGNDMNRIYIVMEYVEHDLKSLMTYTMKKPFTLGEIKTLMLQLLAGVNHLHDNWIVHRDLKTSNLLLSNKGILKIGDFGLSREYGSPLKPYTPVVVTLWYRAPELLLGAKEYSTPIDIWSVGGIFGELLLMKPLFPGKSEVDQLNRIFKDLGTPNEKIWPDYNNLPNTKKTTFSNYPYNRLRARFDNSLSEKGFDLINKFLTYDPSKRITAELALKHTYFDESPRPIEPSMFPTWPSRNEEKDKIPGRMGTNNEPKPPSAGKMYEKLLGVDEDINYHLLQPEQSIGFQLRG